MPFRLTTLDFTDEVAKIHTVHSTLDKAYKAAFTARAWFNKMNQHYEEIVLTPYNCLMVRREFDEDPNDESIEIDGVLREADRLADDAEQKPQNDDYFDWNHGQKPVLTEVEQMAMNAMCDLDVFEFKHTPYDRVCSKLLGDLDTAVVWACPGNDGCTSLVCYVTKID